MTEGTFEFWPKHEPGRYLCTPEKPRPPGAPGQWVHRSVSEIGEQENGWPNGDIVTKKCHGCGLVWRQELPQ